MIVEIDKKIIPQILKGEFEVELSDPPPLKSVVEVFCGKVKIAKVLILETENGVTLGEVLAISCFNAAHGSAYDEKLAKITIAASKVMNISMKSSQCTLCGGSEWLLANTPSAKYAAIMSATFNIFRGIKLEPQPNPGLTNKQSTDMMQDILSFL